MVPGLPARPSFNAPNVSREQLFDMHQGKANPSAEAPPGQGPARQFSNPQAQSVDDLISSAAQQSAQTTPAAGPKATPTPTPLPERPAPPAEKVTTTEKKAEGEGKKGKRPSRLVYNHEDASPEERMSQLSRYDFVPDKHEETVRAPVGGTMTGVVQDSDKVLDPSG